MASRTPLVENFEDIVEITHVEDGPFAFWITLESESYDFHQFLARLNSEPTVPYQGKFYKNQLLKVEYNKMLWRALLINYNDSQDMYTVILPDKGLCIEVNSDSFYDIHNDYSTIGYFAHLVTLHMAEETLNAKDPRIYDWFCQLSNSQRSTFQMRIVTPPSTNHKASCELYLKETRPYRDTNSSASGLQSMLAALQARQHMRYSDLPLDLSKELEVQVSAVTSKSPWSFGARLASNEAELGILQADLQEFCKDQALPLSVIPKPEEPIFTFYKGNWFRAKTRQVINAPSIHVKLVDFGIIFFASEEESRLADYKLVTKMPAQSIQCRLLGADDLPLGQQFLDLTAVGNFKIKVLHTLETEELVVKMFDTSVVPPVDICTQLLAIAGLPREIPAAFNSVWEQNSESSEGSHEKSFEQDSTSQQRTISHLNYSKESRWEDGGGDSFSRPSYSGQEKGVSNRPLEMKQPLPAPNAANHMLGQPLRRPMLKPSVGKKTLCLVVFTETPDDFYIQLDDWQKQIESMKAQIARRCQEAEAPPFQTLFKGASCLAQSQLDSVWYRAKVQDIYPGSKRILVKFTDYGNSEEVDVVTSVVSITPELDQVPPLVIHCSLLQACSLDQQWTDHDIEQFIATWEGKKLEVEFVEREVIGSEAIWVVILRDDSAAAPVEHPTSRKLSPSYASEPPTTFQAQAPAVPQSASSVCQANVKPAEDKSQGITATLGLPQSQTSTMYQTNVKPAEDKSQGITATLGLPQSQTSTMYQTNASFPPTPTSTFSRYQGNLPTPFIPTAYPTGLPLPPTSYQPNPIPPANPMYQAHVPTFPSVQQSQSFTNAMGFPHGSSSNYQYQAMPFGNSMAFLGMPRFQGLPNALPMFRPNAAMMGMSTNNFQNLTPAMTHPTNTTFPLAPSTNRFPTFQTHEQYQPSTSYQANVPPVVQTAFQANNTADTSYQANVPPVVQTAFQANNTADASYQANSATAVTSTTYQGKTVYSAVPTDEKKSEFPKKIQSTNQATPSVEPTPLQSKRLSPIVTNTVSQKRPEIPKYKPPHLRNLMTTPLSSASPRPAAFDTTDSSAEPIPAPQVFPKVSLVIPEMKLPSEETAVTISCFMSPHEFYVQLTSRSAEYDDLQSRIQRASASLSQPDPMQISKDELVLAPRESGLHRARVDAIKDDKAKCIFLDLGGLTRVVKLAALLPLPDWACEDPVFSLQCKLAGVVPVGPVWNLQACQDAFYRSTEYLLTVLNAEEHEVELRCPESGLCVSQLLSKAGAATVPDQNPAENVMLGMGEDHTVFVSFLQGDILHLQLAQAQRKLELLQQLLQAAAPRLQSFDLDTNKHNRQLAAARSLRDDQWYRALPLGPATTEGLPVYFVDFGPCDLVWEVRQLSPALASVPYLSVPARLPCTLKLDAYSVLDDILESSTPVKVRVMHQGLDCLICDLQVSGSSLLQKLVDFSLATPLLGEAYMTYIESPRYFALQPKDCESTLQELEQRLATEQFPPLTTPPKVGDLCLAQFTDLSWYRVKVNSLDGPQVLFIDYGNCESVSELREMPADMTEIPAMAKFCQLSVIHDNDEEHFMQLATEDAFQVLWPSNTESQPIKVVLMKDSQDIMPATPHPLQFTLEGFGLSVPLGEQEPETAQLEVEPQESDATEQPADDAHNYETEPEESNELNMHTACAAAPEQQADGSQKQETENIDELSSHAVHISEEEACDQVQDMSDFWNDSGVEDTNKDFQGVEECPKVDKSSEMQKFAMDASETPDNWEDISIESSATETGVSAVEDAVRCKEEAQVKPEPLKLSKESVDGELQETNQVKSEDSELNKESLNEEVAVSRVISEDSELNKESLNEEVAVSRVISEDLELDTENVNEELQISELQSEHSEPNEEIANEELQDMSVSQVTYEHSQLNEENVNEEADVSQVNSEDLMLDKELVNGEVHEMDVSEVNSEDLEFSTSMENKLDERLKDTQTIQHEIDELSAMFATEKQCDDEAHSDTSSHVSTTESQDVLLQAIERDLPQAEDNCAESNLPAAPPVCSVLPKELKVSIEALSAPLDEFDDFDEEPLEMDEKDQVMWSLGDPDILAQYSRDSSEASLEVATEMNPHAEDFQPGDLLDHLVQVSVDEYQEAIQHALESSGENPIELQQPLESPDKEEKVQHFLKELYQTETELSCDHQPEIEYIDDQQPPEPIKEAVFASEMSGENQGDNQQPEPLESIPEMSGESQGNNKQPEPLESIPDMSGENQKDNQQSEALESTHETSSPYEGNQQASEALNVESACELEPLKEVESADENQKVIEQHLETLKQIEPVLEMLEEHQAEPLKDLESPTEISGEYADNQQQAEALKDFESSYELQPQPYCEVQSADDEKPQGENQQTSEPLKQVDSSDESLEVTEHYSVPSEVVSRDATLSLEVHQQSTESVKEVNPEPLIESSGDCQEATLEMLKEVESIDELALENEEAMQQPLAVLSSKKQEILQRMVQQMYHDETLSEISVTPQESIETLEVVSREIQHTLEALEQLQSLGENPNETQDDHQLTTKELVPVELSGECEEARQQTTEAPDELPCEHQTPPDSLEEVVSPDKQLATNCSQLFTIESTDESETSEDLDSSSAQGDTESSGISLYERQQLRIQLDSVLEEARETVVRQVSANCMEQKSAIN